MDVPSAWLHLALLHRSGNGDAQHNSNMVCVGGLCVDAYAAAAAVSFPLLLHLLFYAAASGSSDSTGSQSLFSNNITILANNTLDMDTVTGNRLQMAVQELMQEQLQEETQSNPVSQISDGFVSVVDYQMQDQSQYQDQEDEFDNNGSGDGRFDVELLPYY